MRHVWVLEKHLKTNSKTKTCSNFSCNFSVIKPAEIGTQNVYNLRDNKEDKVVCILI